MKIIGLDIGDVWTGIALSDALGMFARPYKTVETMQLQATLTALLAQESISTIVVGHPTTLRGTKSEQTKKVEAFLEQLKKQFPSVQWALWDERLTSKQADKLKSPKNKEEKIHAHSVAAAFILSGYLDYLHLQKSLDS